MKESAEQRLIRRCRKLGQAMPSKISHETLAEILTKIIVEEKMNSIEAFIIASKAFSEGFNNVELEEYEEFLRDETTCIGCGLKFDDKYTDHLACGFASKKEPK